MLEGIRAAGCGCRTRRPLTSGRRRIVSLMTAAGCRAPPCRQLATGQMPASNCIRLRIDPPAIVASLDTTSATCDGRPYLFIYRSHAFAKRAPLTTKHHRNTTPDDSQTPALWRMYPLGDVETQCYDRVDMKPARNHSYNSSYSRGAQPRCALGRIQDSNVSMGQ